MLKLISDRLQQHVHDDMLEIAWSAMWNVTDETPVNCQRFLDGHGMTYFQKCLRVSGKSILTLFDDYQIKGSLRKSQILILTFMKKNIEHFCITDIHIYSYSYPVSCIESHVQSPRHPCWHSSFITLFQKFLCPLVPSE